MKLTDQSYLDNKMIGCTSIILSGLSYNDQKYIKLWD